MSWSYKWGDKVNSGFYHRLLISGLLRDEDAEPHVEPFGLYLEAFKELSSCRINGLGLGPIPFTAIHKYSTIYDVGDFYDFHYVIRKMDDTLLALENSKAKGKANGGNNNPGKANHSRGIKQGKS